MTDEPTTETVECPKCGTEFSLVAQATLCPSCEKKIHRVVLATTAKGYPDMQAKAIPPGRGKSAYFQWIKTGYEFFRKTRRWHLRERLIDRREKRYREYIEDAETGEVIRHKDERLSEHLAERDHRRKERSAED
jgi:endogenous inhibitor of DNA gyrase (YacG/DUF329 family)